MTAPLPPTLRVCLCWQAAPENKHAEATAALVLALRTALVGGAAASYLSSDGDLDVELDLLDTLPADAPDVLLGQALHTLLVVLADRNLGSDADYGAWLEGAYTAVRSADGRHGLRLFVSSAEVAMDLTDTAPALMQGAQATALAAFGETAVRGAHLALAVLNEARTLLTAAAQRQGLGKALSSVFISHAKGDGLPLAMAMRDHLKGIPHHGGASGVFYDESSLLLSEDWQHGLKAGVAASLLLVLRTDGYDGRHWCREEVRAAEDHANPAVVVDARVGLCQRASELALGDLPTVRIPDGNLIRALHLILREGLRAAMLSARVAAMQARGVLPAGAEVRVLHRAPTERSIQTLAAGLAEDACKGVWFVFYPDPPLSPARQEALEYLLRARLPEAWLGTPTTHLAAAAAQAARSDT